MKNSFGNNFIPNNQYILVISAVYPPEPVVSARLSADLYESLKKEGGDVKVIHPRPTRPNGFEFDIPLCTNDDDITVESYTCPRSSLIGRTRESFSFGKSCARFIKDNHKEIDRVYANVWAFGSQLLIVKAAKKYGIPVIMHVQDVYPESLTNKMPSFVGGILNEILLPIDKYILRNSKMVVAISDKMKNYLSKTRQIDTDKIKVVINWQDETDFLEYQKNYPIETHESFTFMYMGNIGPVAGVDLLIDAFNHLDAPNTKLVIAGSGTMKAFLQEKAKNYKNIEFWEVPNGKVPEIQAKADVMLLPIKGGAASSSIPSKLPAYMFSAKPIIGAMDRDSDTADAIIEACCGDIVEPDNKLALSDKMKEMMGRSRKELEGIGLMGQEYALKHFTKEENLKNLIQIIKG